MWRFMKVKTLTVVHEKEDGSSEKNCKTIDGYLFVKNAYSLEDDSVESNDSGQDGQLQFGDLEEKAELDGACNHYSGAAVEALSKEIWNNYVNTSHTNGSNEDNEFYHSSILEGEPDERQYIENHQSITPEKKLTGLYNEQEDLEIKLRQQKEEQCQYNFKEKDKRLKEEIAMRELLELDHLEKIDALRKENKNMKEVVFQYEHLILELREQTRQLTDATLTDTICDHKKLQQDLNKAESSLADAYKIIGKQKVALETDKKHDESLKYSIKDSQSKLFKSEDRYKKLRQQATDKIDAANAEIQKVRKQKGIDLAALKKSQIRNIYLEKEVRQKMRENEELSQICEALIKKVPGETD